MALQDSTLRLLRKRYEESPKNVVEIIKQGKLENVVKQLQVDFSLSDIQSNKLSDEIVLTLLFFCPTADLNMRIARELSLPQEKAESIGAYVYQMIFSSLDYIFEDETPVNSEAYRIEDKEVVANPNTPPQSPVPSAPASPTANIRTMQGDIQATSQEDILKGKQEAKIDDNTPRWGNQT